ncbi:MAG: acyl carrier protein [Candidatus Glassbacteria bacterium]
MAKMDEGEVFTKVVSLLSEALGVPAEEISMDSHLEQDLGAESIDYLDVIFRIEREFNFKIPTEISPEETKKIDSLPGDKDFTELEGKVDLESLMNLATVRAIVDYIQYRLEKGGE